MKHQNPAMNVTLTTARKLREYLNACGFPVDAIVGNPNRSGGVSSGYCPEDNLPGEYELLNLEFKFQSVRDQFPVAQIIGILESPGLAAVANLHKTLWPNASQDDLAGRLMRVPAINREMDHVLQWTWTTLQAGGGQGPSWTPREEVQKLSEFLLEMGVLGTKPEQGETAVDFAIRLLSRPKSHSRSRQHR